MPEGYAQKAMASLMQLHTELMDEKERRVELHRQLMEKEQALAELKMYVKLLEEKVEQRPPDDAASLFKLSFRLCTAWRIASAARQALRR